MLAFFRGDNDQINVISNKNNVPTTPNGTLKRNHLTNSKSHLNSAEFRVISEDSSKTRFNVSSSEKLELLIEVSKDGQQDLIIGGTVDKLIECLTYGRLERERVGVGTAYIEEFLFTYNYFTTSSHVMNKMRKMCVFLCYLSHLYLL